MKKYGHREINGLYKKYVGVILCTFSKKVLLKIISCPFSNMKCRIQFYV